MDDHCKVCGSELTGPDDHSLIVSVEAGRSLNRFEKTPQQTVSYWFCDYGCMRDFLSGGREDVFEGFSARLEEMCEDLDEYYVED